MKEFSKRAPHITDKQDYVHYLSFLGKLTNFELAGRIDRGVRRDLVARSMASTILNANSMSFEDVISNFGDVAKVDPSLTFAHKVEELIKADKQYTLMQYTKLLKRIYRAKTPRLYINLASTVVGKLETLDMAKEELKNVIFVLSLLLRLEKCIYAKFNICSKLVENIMNRKAEWS